MIKVVEMHVDAEELRKTEGILGNFTKTVAEMMKETNALHGNLAEKAGLDIDKIAEDMRICVMIGAAACRMLADAAEAAEKKGGAEHAEDCGDDR
jgi:hypothetical protein